MSRRLLMVLALVCVGACNIFSGRSTKNVPCVMDGDCAAGVCCAGSKVCAEATACGSLVLDAGPGLDAGGRVDGGTGRDGGGGMEDASLPPGIPAGGPCERVAGQPSGCADGLDCNPSPSGLGHMCTSACSDPKCDDAYGRACMVWDGGQACVTVCPVEGMDPVSRCGPGASCRVLYGTNRKTFLGCLPEDSSRCPTDGTCESGRCVTITPEKAGTCVPPCGQAGACAAGTVCRDREGNIPGCLPEGPVAEGGLCFSDSQCGADSVCEGYADTLKYRRCRKVCSADAGCGAGRACAKPEDWRGELVCLETCTYEVVGERRSCGLLEANAPQTCAVLVDAGTVQDGGVLPGVCVVANGTVQAGATCSETLQCAGRECIGGRCRDRCFATPHNACNNAGQCQAPQPGGLGVCFY